MLRRTLEIISRNVVLKKRLPSALGRHPIYVSPGSALRYWLPSLYNVDRTLFEVALKCIRKGEVVWDIGASVGLFTFASSYLAGTSGQVLAVEPDPWSIRLLEKSRALKENATLNVEILLHAVTSSLGTAKLCIANRGRSASWIEGVVGSTNTGGTRETLNVKTITLDWMFEKYSTPNFVKIDAEGSEIDILKSATKILTEAKPIILCETLHRNKNAVADLLRTSGYALHDADLMAATRVLPTSDVQNILAYPEDKISAIRFAKDRMEISKLSS